ncbi:MAG: helix-turn-helix transcriptional regulator, partial [Nitrospinae bacterium]|nr:helix-turn-helix transcriptional regulator [Nitrospinota bacterium]
VQLPAELAALSGEHIESRMVWYAPTMPQFTRIAREAVANPYRGPAKQFFLESKALEMLSEMAVLLDHSSPPPEEAVTEDDRARMHEVRHTLMASYDNPPSLVDLARGAGMSHKKLNHIFGREFGVSMHMFLRDYRLEQGNKMIAEGRGVKETAYSLGYRHPSNFIAAYRKKFGASPGAHGKSTA